MEVKNILAQTKLEIRKNDIIASFGPRSFEVGSIVFIMKHPRPVMIISKLDIDKNSPL